jgi:MSHA biogenesis protein MshN
MSVINRVLRDLEQRNASQPPSAPPDSGVAVRAVTPPRSGGRARIAAGVATVAAVAVAVVIVPSLIERDASAPQAQATPPAGPPPVAARAEPLPEPAPVPATAAAPVHVAAAPGPVTDVLPKPDALWGSPVESKSAPVRSPARADGPAPASARAQVADTAPLPTRAPQAPAAKPRVTDSEPAAEEANAVRIEKRERPMSARERAELAFRAGVSALDRRQTAEAAAHFDEALGLAADHLAARQAMLGILLEARRTQDAEALLLEGLDHVRHAPFALVASRLQLERGDVRAALATLEAHEDVGRANPDYVATLASVLQRAGRHGEAADRYQAAIAAGNPRATWFMGRAISLRELGRGAEARTSFQQAMDTGSLAPEVQMYVEKQIAALRTAGS